jgi:glycosyltransferase involved in cell wall biosynthesis
VAARTGGKFALYVKTAGFPLLELPSNVRSLRSIWHVRRALRHFRPDVIHANDPHGLWLQWIATWGLPVPARVASRRLLFPIRSTRRYRNGCDRVLCASRAIADVCRASGIPTEMITVVHEGTDPRRMSGGDARRGRVSLGLAEDVPLVLCVAQLADYKGHRYLLDAVPAVLKAQPRTIFALAGDGPLRNELMAQMRSLAIEPAVRFLGYRNDVPDLVQACNTFVLASTQEGLGTSVMDAMFAARPVVAAAAGGIPEMLRNNNGELCGWLVNAGDARALAGGLVECLSLPRERERRVELATAWANNHFTASRMLRETLESYSDILSSRGRSVLTNVA